METDAWITNLELLLDAVFSECCFGSSQRRISDKAAHTSTFDFGGLIDQFAFIVGEVNESFFPKAWCGSPTRCVGLFLRHNQMVSPNSRPSSHSTGPIWERPTERARPGPAGDRLALYSQRNESALAPTTANIALSPARDQPRILQVTGMVTHG
jgi:hypothetical protein